MIVNNSTNIKKTKESLKSDSQQFLHYQQNKRKLKQWWSTIPPIWTKQKKVETVMVDNSTNINKTNESLNSDGQHFLQYQHTKRKFKQWWTTILPISTKQRNLYSDGQHFLKYQPSRDIQTVMVDNSSIINKTKKA